MAERIHLVLSRAEKERYRRVAARQGLSLSEWLRSAAEAQVAAEEAAAAGALDTREALEQFFHECDQRARGPEPDWDDQKRVIERSKLSGGSGT